MSMPSTAAVSSSLHTSATGRWKSSFERILVGSRATCLGGKSSKLVRINEKEESSKDTEWWVFVREFATRHV